MRPVAKADDDENNLGFACFYRRIPCFPNRFVWKYWDYPDSGYDFS